jgi:hypothetical protein
MAKSQKVIITCAVTGSIHTPSMSPHIPVTASEIADAAIGAAEAGAAVVHLHARDPKDGRPDQSPEAFAPFLKVIKQSSKAVINITTGGAPTMSIEERVRPAATFKPEVASLNMGSMNFGLYPMLPRFKGKLKHAWEEPYLEGSRERIFKNTFADIEYILKTCAENGTRFEIECYDIGHLYTLQHFLERGDRARKLPLVRARRRPQPDADRRDGGRDGRQRARRPRGLALDRTRQARRVERRAGHQGAPDHRRAGAGDRDAGRGARDPRAQGRRQGGVLIFIPPPKGEGDCER